MSYQAIFKRHELKYLLTLEQKARLLQIMEPYMARDSYGRTTVRNLYYDTPSYRLIRHSIEKPVYKEKLRIRSYSRAGENDPVFVELKKKYKGTVYKRRLSLPLQQALDWLCGGECPVEGQIASEITYFRDFYRELRPAVFLSYEREAYYCRQGSDLRLTFDDHILCRQSDLHLSQPPVGESILSDGLVLMEIKTSGSVPLWLCQALTRERIFKTSFSKYGTAYQTLIHPNHKGDYQYA